MQKEPIDRLNLFAGALLVVILGACISMVGAIVYYNFTPDAETTKLNKSRKAKKRAKAKGSPLSKVGKKGKNKAKKGKGKRKAKRKAALADMTPPGPIEQRIEETIRSKGGDVRMVDMRRFMDRKGFQLFRRGETPFSDDKDFKMLMKTWSNPGDPNNDAFAMTVFHRRRLVAVVHTGRIQVRGVQPKPVGSTAWMTPVGTLKPKKRKRLNVFLHDVFDTVD